jgi:hypothetical protein
MKVVFRLLHFLLYLYVYLRAALSRKVHAWKQSVRHTLLWALHSFNEDRIVKAFSARMTKKLTHSAIVLNHVSNEGGSEGLTREEILKLSEVVSWLVFSGSRQVTLFDEAGLLGKEQEFIQSEIIRRISAGQNNGLKATVRKLGAEQRR